MLSPLEYINSKGAREGICYILSQAGPWQEAGDIFCCEFLREFNKGTISRVVGRIKEMNRDVETPKEKQQQEVAITEGPTG